jgi:transcriptional regulator with XRE-family HTH domain
MDRPTIVEIARRAAGLTQTQLARRAGTSQSAVSEYERRRKSPALEVVERLMWAADADLGMVTRVAFSPRTAPGLSTFFVPDRLWRVEVPQCFARVTIPDLTRQTDQGVWDLGNRVDRTRLYEILLVEGSDLMIYRWVDAALLVDVWADLELPEPIRQAWDPLVRVASQGQAEDAWHAHVP